MHGSVGDVVPFLFDHFKGMLQLWLPVQVEADMHAQIGAWGGGGVVGGICPSHNDHVVQLGGQDGATGGVEGVGSVQDPSDLTLGVVEGDTCPLVVGEDFSALDLEVLWIAGDGCGVISISQASCAIFVSQLGLVS